MDHAQIVREALDSWFEDASNLPITEPCILHAFDRTIEVASEEYRSILRGFRSGFPDIGWRIRRVVSDATGTVAHADLVGTHLGRWSDLEPTRRRIEWEHMLLFRFDGDLIAEVWEIFDPAQITEQLSAAR